MIKRGPRKRASRCREATLDDLLGLRRFGECVKRENEASKLIVNGCK